MTITDALNHFCKEITGQKPILAPVAPEPWAEPHQCFGNVDKMVKKHGGNRCLGWHFQHKPFGSEPGIFLAAHHAIWKSPEGNLLDITPPAKYLLMDDGYIWFLLDPAARLLRPSGSKIEIPRPSHVWSPSQNPGVQTLVRALRRAEKADDAVQRASVRVANILRSVEAFPQKAEDVHWPISA
jgi:hypothetical protein